MKEYEVEMKDQMKLSCISENESNAIGRLRDMKIEDHLEALNSFKVENAIFDMKIVIGSSIIGLKKEKIKNDKDCII